MSTPETLGASGALDLVIATAKEAQRLRETGAPVVWCEVCEADTVPREGICIWCGNKL